MEIGSREGSGRPGPRGDDRTAGRSPETDALQQRSEARIVAQPVAHRLDLQVHGVAGPLVAALVQGAERAIGVPELRVDGGDIVGAHVLALTPLLELPQDGTRLGPLPRPRLDPTLGEPRPT